MTGGGLRAAAVLVSWTLGAAADDGTGIAVGDAWIAAPPPGVDVAAGYATVTGGADRLISVTADFAAAAELHLTVAGDDGIVRMRPVGDGLAVTAGDPLVLAPGGPHIMFTGLGQSAADGARLAVTLVFERAGEVEVAFPVRRRAGEP